MIMLNIAIVEDDASDMKAVNDCLDYIKKKDGIEYNVVEFVDAEHFLFISSFEFDLVFLDIQMPSIDGMSAAKKIREKNQTIGIVFITNLRQLAIKGYDVEALDFIVKPIEKNDFYLKMKHILKRLNFTKKDEILIGSGDKLAAISANSINYLEVLGHYVIYHTPNGTVSEYSTLKEVERKLYRYPFFVRCNRCYLVNLNHIDEIRGDAIVVVCGTSLAISRARKAAFLNEYAKYVSGLGSKS
jgi:DNA-binding LytR/AlgR family response regulator